MIQSIPHDLNQIEVPSDIEGEGPTDRDRVIESAFQTEMCEVPADEENGGDSGINDEEGSVSQPNFKHSIFLNSQRGKINTLESYNNNSSQRRQTGRDSNTLRMPDTTIQNNIFSHFTRPNEFQKGPGTAMN